MKLTIFSAVISSVANVSIMPCTSRLLMVKTYVIPPLFEALLTSKKFQSCPSCDKVFEELKDIEMPEMDRDDASEADDEDNGTKRKGQKLPKIAEDSKGRDLNGFEPRSHSTWLPLSDKDKIKLVPSSKTAVLKSLLLSGFRESPLDKVSFECPRLTFEYLRH